MEPLKESVVTGIVNRVRERMKHGSEYNLTALIEFEIPKMYKADRREILQGDSKSICQAQRRSTSRTSREPQARRGIG